jgi:hypothetical protein
VLAHVGQPFLHDAVDREPEALVHRHRPTLGPERRAHAAPADEPRHVRETGLRVERWRAGRGVVDAEQAEQPAQLGQRLPAVLLDLLQGLGGGCVVGQVAALRGGLHHDRRDVVGDHVVQLPRDAAALLEGRGMPRLLLDHGALAIDLAA